MEEEKLYLRLRDISLTEFPDIVTDAVILRGVLNFPKSVRIFLRDNSFIEIWTSGERYSYHWERRHRNGTMYRHDNAPHHAEIKTHPKHFHNGSEENVVESYINNKREDALREFLRFARGKLELH